MIAEKVTYETRLATVDDLPSLSAAYGEMLRWLDGQEYHLLPTFNNVDWMVENIFRKSLNNGLSSIIIAESNEEEISGVLFWVQDDFSALDERFKKGTSYGQWVSRDHRGNKLVEKMVRLAVENFRALGVSQVYDMIHVDSARIAAEQAGFNISEKVVILEL